MQQLTSRQIKIWISILVCIIVSAVIGISAWSIISERAHDIAAAERQAAGYARALSEHTESAFAEATRIMNDSLKEIDHGGGVDRMSQRELFDVMRRQVGGSPQIGSAFLVDRSGTMFVNSLEFPSKQISVADREYFRHYLNTTGAGFTISRPVMSRLVGRWRFNLMHPLNPPGRQFSGLMAVVFETEYFKSFFSPASLGPQGLVMLVRNDGAPLVYEPLREKSYERNFASSELFRDHLPNNPVGTYRTGQSGIDGEPRIVSYQKLSRFPVVAVVSLHRDDVLGAWMNKAILQSCLTLALCLLIIGLTFYLFRHLDSLKDVGKRLIEKQELLRIKAAQIDAANDAILQVDWQGGLIQFNHAFCRITGYDQEELKGFRLQDIEKPDCVSLGFPVMKLLGETMEATFESCYLSKDGRQVPVEVHARAMESDGRSLVLSVVRDVSERKRSEAREQSRLMILEKMATGAALGEILVDIVHFVEQQCDGAASSILLADEDGTRLRHGAAPSLPDWYNKAVDGLKIANGMGSCGTAAFQKRRIIVEDIETHPYWKGFDPAGKAGFKACWSEPILSTDGELLGTFAMYYRDSRAPQVEEIALLESAAHLASLAVSHVRGEQLQKRLEEQLLQMQKIEAVGQLAGGIAHDFNNLLTPVIVYAEMIKNGLGKDSPLLRKAEGILQASFKARDLTGKLLSFSRRQVLSLEIIDLNSLVLSFQEILRRTIRENISIEMLLSAEATLIKADKGQVEQILLNLFVNAQDAIEDKGDISVRTGRVVIDREFASLHPGMREGRYIQLMVADNGCGINDSTMQHIFEPFFTTKQVGHGTGLGLATVYGIIKQHDGYVTVSSRVGEGSIFTVYLPAVEDEPVAEESKDEQPGGESLARVRTYLVVEDNDIVREMVVEMLRATGSTVLASGCPSAALDLARSYEKKIDLLVSDVVMPEMNGQELYERILENRPGLHVLYISGYSHKIVAHRGNLEERVSFLQKPFTTEEFMKRADAILAQCD